jgi:hypothetical protein
MVRLIDWVSVSRLAAVAVTCRVYEPFGVELPAEFTAHHNLS